MSKNTVLAYEARILTAIEALPDALDLSSRLVGVYAGLRLAEQCEYRKDLSHRLAAPARKALLTRVANSLGAPPAAPRAGAPETAEVDVGAWLAGYHFNSALARMAAVAEIAVKALCKKHACHEELYARQAAFLRSRLKLDLRRLGVLRREVNCFKHESRPGQKRLRETMSDALESLEELLVLVAHLYESRGPGTGRR